MYEQRSDKKHLSPSAQVSKVNETYPDGTITSIKYYDDPTRTTEIGLMENGQMSKILQLFNFIW